MILFNIPFHFRHKYRVKLASISSFILVTNPTWTLKWSILGSSWASDMKLEVDPCATMRAAAKRSAARENSDQRSVKKKTSKTFCRRIKIAFWVLYPDIVLFERPCRGQLPVSNATKIKNEPRKWRKADDRPLKGELLGLKATGSMQNKLLSILKSIKFSYHVAQNFEHI